MKEQKIKHVILHLLALVACLLLASCQKQPQMKADEPVTASNTESSAIKGGDAQPKVETARGARQPTQGEAEEALKRVYQQVVTMDKNQTGSFVVGDFNGDGSEDIAVAVVAAKGKLAEVNGEFANWIIVDPKRVALPDAGEAAAPPLSANGPVKIEQRDSLLAIIHGYGEDGWRNAEAKQTYLLKGAAGEGMRVVPLKDFPEALRVRKNGGKSRADIIVEKLAGAQGFLYWIDGKYVWHQQSG